jgi:hypothetical protein
VYQPSRGKPLERKRRKEKKEGRKKGRKREEG